MLAAGDVLGAGSAFLRVAHSALETAAFLDCIAACDQAIDALARLERSPERDDVLATLHRTRADANFAIGEASPALCDADQAVSLERGANSTVNLGRALVVRARCNEWIGQLSFALNDLEEAASLARIADDRSLLAASLTALSAAARVRGHRESALSLGREAYELAVAAEDWPRAQAAVGELLLTYCAWWDVGSASLLAATSLELMQRCGEAQQASHYGYVAVLSYVRERYIDAKRDLAKASQMVSRSSPPSVFFNRLMSAIVALSEARWDDALNIAGQIDALSDSNYLRAQKSTLAALRVEAFVSRDAPGDRESAEISLPPSAIASTPFSPGTFPSR